MNIVKEFLAQHAEFVLEPAQQFVNPALVNPEGHVETYPYKHGMDGSFAVRLKKNA